MFQLYSSHPWLGRGLFTFVPRYYRILDNQAIMWLLELGAIGTAVVVTFIAVGFFSARGARLRALDERSRLLALALSAGVAGVILSYVTFDAWGFPMAAGLTFLLLGMSGAAWTIARDEQHASAAERATHPQAEVPTALPTAGSS